MILFFSLLIVYCLMIPYFVFDHFYLGPVKIYTWGLFVGLAFVAGYFLTLWRSKRAGIDQTKIAILSLVIFFGVAIGSRVLFLLQNPAVWLVDVSLLWRIDQGGMMLWGGILGGILFAWLYIRKTKLNFWRLADLVAPAIALGIGIGRIGCFLINDHMGAPTSLPWGILWPDGIARHPVALYESLVGFGLFATFLLIEKYMKKIPPNLPLAKGGTPSFFKGGLGRIFRRSGQLFLLFVISYAVIRFFLDFLRASSGPLADPRWWGLTSSQCISIFVALIYLFLYIKKRNIQFSS